MNEKVISRKDIVLAPEMPPDRGSDPRYFDKRCESLSLRTIVESGAAEYILARPNHPHFMKLLDFVTDRSRGKVPDLVRNEHVITPAVMLPAKQPEQIPDATFEVVTDAGEAVLVVGPSGSARGVPEGV